MLPRRSGKKYRDKYVKEKNKNKYNTERSQIATKIARYKDCFHHPMARTAETRVRNGEGVDDSAENEGEFDCEVLGIDSEMLKAPHLSKAYRSELMVFFEFYIFRDRASKEFVCQQGVCRQCGGVLTIKNEDIRLIGKAEEHLLMIHSGLIVGDVSGNSAGVIPVTRLQLQMMRVMKSLSRLGNFEENGGGIDVPSALCAMMWSAVQEDPAS